MTAITLGPVRYDNLTVEEAVSAIFSLISGDRKCSVFFLNLDCLRISHKDVEYGRILREADLVLPDGIGLKLVTFLFGWRMRDNCNGTDFIPIFMKAVNKKNLRVFLLGGRPGIADLASVRLINDNPSLKVVGTTAGYFQDNGEVIRKINNSAADILLVGMGTPSQEKWIAQNRRKLFPRVCIGVGGFFDWLSGKNRRAPTLWRRLHLEWLWRIFLEPGRLGRRYLVDGLGFFLYLVWKRIAGGGFNRGGR